MEARSDVSRSRLKSDNSCPKSDTEPHYMNFKATVDRSTSSPSLPSGTGNKVPKKPKPGPKPTVVPPPSSQVKASGPPPAVPLKPSAVSAGAHSEVQKVKNPKPTVSPSSPKAAVSFASGFAQNANSSHADNEENIYDEASAVNIPLRIGGVPGSFPCQNGLYADADAEPIYEEAAPVNRLLAVKPALPSLPKPKPNPPVPDSNLYDEAQPVARLEENIYEEAAAVVPNKLQNSPKTKKPTSKHAEPPTSKEPEPLYDDPAAVVLERLPIDEKVHLTPNPMGRQKTAAKQKVEAPKADCIYEEAAAVCKVEEGNSDNEEEEPLYYRLMVLKRSLNFNTGTKLWNAKTDSTLAKRELDNKALRLSRAWSNAVPVLPKRPEAGLPALQRPGCAAPFSYLAGPQGIAENSSNLDTQDTMLDGMLPACSDEQSAKMRKFMISNILNSERDYLGVLDRLSNYMNTFKSLAVSKQQSVISVADIDVIFFKIPELHETHYKFIHGLEPKLEKWSPTQEVGPVFKEFALEEYQIAPQYLKNYQGAIAAVQRCTADNSQFADLTKKGTMCQGSSGQSLEELLHLPILRFQRNTLLLHDLINLTPVNHPDYDMLQKTLKLAQNFLLELTEVPSSDKLQSQRYLVKRGIVVETVKESRRLQHIFLFNDLFVCAKPKVSRHTISFEVRWYIPLPDLRIEDKFSVKEEKQIAQYHQEEIDKMKTLLVNLQREYQTEMKKLQSKSATTRVHNKNIERITKKIADQKANLVLNSPNLTFKVCNWKLNKEYLLLMESDYERTNWKDIIKGLQSNKVSGPVSVTLNDVQQVLNDQKMVHEMEQSANFDGYEEEYLNGNLHITIHKLLGVKAKVATGIFCSIEVDSYGHFFEKAKTNVLKKVEPDWNEDFDIDLEGTQTLRILCYKLGSDTDSLVGKCALELSQAWLEGGVKEETIPLCEGIVVVVSLIYTSCDELMKRSARETLFGGQLSSTVQQESGKIPLIVTSCISELERRGLKDVGLYRVSGLAASVEAWKKDFNKNSSAAAKRIQEAETNVLTGLIKLYFRELPEALFTDAVYPLFVKGMGLSDPDAKEKYMISQFSCLPEVNYATAVYVIDHLVKVAKNEEYNKMSLQNLATVFGPTLLHPAKKQMSHRNAMEQLLYQGNEASMQTAILLYFLNLKQKNGSFSVDC